MNYAEAMAKLKKQQKMIKNSVRCFVENDKFGQQLNELSAFFQSQTDIKHIVISQDASQYMLVAPKHYYLASVLGAQYALSHELNNIALITPTGEFTTNLGAIISSPEATQILDGKMIDKIASHEERTPF